MSENLSSLDLGIIIVYIIIVLSIGFYFRKKSKSSEEYFLAGRSIGWIAIAAWMGFYAILFKIRCVYYARICREKIQYCITLLFKHNFNYRICINKNFYRTLRRRYFT